ncbi:MAG TPA: hypothetical protein P5084_12705 [Paludibacter sp.]|nr:hypothetical protein [Paludibacter sp.]
MKTEKKSQKAIAVILLLAVGLIYNSADYSQIMYRYENSSNFSNSLNENLENTRTDLATYTIDFLKSGFNNIFSNK